MSNFNKSVPDRNDRKVHKPTYTERHLSFLIVSIKTKSKCQAPQMTTETVQFFQYEHGSPYTSHYHVFYEQIQYHRLAIPIQIHYLADMKRRIGICNEQKRK